MTEATRTCSKCAGALREGFLLDFTDNNILRDQALWVEGQREKAAWVGTKLNGKDVREVDALRCEKCGFLEFYATRRRRDYLI
jgi:hypothetical protein